jgi:hypothetical protein
VGVAPTEARTCVCGNKGCLQTLVSVPSIVRSVERALADGVQTALARPANGAGAAPVTLGAAPALGIVAAACGTLSLV